MKEQDNTEIRIKEAARKLFQEKGFNAVTTREIAESAGINSALLHYYYRSKEKLFRIIMSESLHEMFAFLSSIINNEETNLAEKIDLIVNGYIDVIQNNPNVALFVFNELHTNPQLLIKEINIPQELVSHSYFFKQVEEQIKKKSIQIATVHIMLNTISLSIMPIIAAPMVAYLFNGKTDDVYQLLDERRKLIPVWVKAMLQLDDDKPM